MARRVLVVAETDPADGDHGKLFGLDPNDASGVAIPAFRSVPSLPMAGTVEGEAVYDRSHKQGFIWTKGNWQGLAPNPIRTYPTESALLADKGAAPGTYATAGDTGNLFVSRATGWGQVGIHEYKTAALLLAATPLKGALGEAVDEGSLWEMTAKGWRCLTTRELKDTDAVLAWANPNHAVGSKGCNIGDQAIDVAHDVTYIRTASGWRPTSIWEAKESVIRAATWCVHGQEAFASDGGKFFTWIHDHWVQGPIQHFVRNIDLLAATPPDGTLAWADDLHNVYARTGGQWQALNTGFSDPTPIGTIAAFATHHIPAGWLLCDGEEIPHGKEYNELRKLLGTTHTPDLRNQFLRGAGSLTETLLAKTAWTTGKPKQDFTLSTDGQHHHNFTLQGSGMDGGRWESLITYNNVAHTYQTTDNGAHTHTITGGGDPETAPDHVKIHWAIKAKFATVLPANQLLIQTGPASADGDVLAYDSVAGAWRNRASTHFGATAPKHPLLGWVWYNTTSKVVSIYDGNDWVTTKSVAKEFFEGTVTLGVNANTVGNEIILIKGIDTTNDGYYISLVDAYHAAERSSIAFHVFATDNTGAAPCVPIHLHKAGRHFAHLRFFWKDGTDKYCVSAKISDGSDSGVVYRVGMMSPTAAMTGIKLDGNTLTTNTNGTVISMEDKPREAPLYVREDNANMVATEHTILLPGGTATRYGKMEGYVQAGENFIARPWLRFGTTIFDFTNKSKIFHVFAMCDYKDGGIQDTGDTFVDNHRCGFVFGGTGGYSVKANTTLMLRMRVQKKSNDYWEVWQEAFFGSDNGTPERMESKYEVGTAGLGDLSGMGVKTLNWNGTGNVNSAFAIDIEYF